MPLKSKDPRKIHDGYKEAVVDSLLNNLGARVAGRGEHYELIYGVKPSRALLSEFLVPMPPEEREGDEEADPIQISAHGLDFQIQTSSLAEKISIGLSAAVYVRILPTQEDVQPGGKFVVSFPLRREVDRELRNRVKASLQALAKELGGSNHPDWAPRSFQARKSAFESMGLSFESARDRSTDENEPEDSSDGTGQTTAVAIPDSLAAEIPPPSKWLRLNLNLPSFEFTAATAEQDAALATAELNRLLREALLSWANSGDSAFAGKLWGYRRGVRIRPSNLLDWEKFIEAVRASDEPVVVPDIQLRWIVKAVQDPIDKARTTIHVAIENWTSPLTKSNSKEIEPSLFQVSVKVSMRASAHVPLQLDRVRPSYRYNRFLKYPALGFNGAVRADQVDDRLCLTTTWSPRYVLPRVVPTAGDVELNIRKLAQPDCIEGLLPLVPSYEAWLKNVEKTPVDQFVDGNNGDELRARERDKLKQDIQRWRAELEAIKCGIEILRSSKESWSGPGAQTDPRGIPFEAWLAMNESMANVASAKGYTEWRLFQLAFVLSSIPAFATRIPAFHSYYTTEIEQHSNAVTLLYFATGGGKSEAFLGLLAFVVFLDRLRGKEQGVSALMRYPLRLLTLQQARRTFSVLGAAEDVRFTRKHPGEPFSLGFWVGGSNTPNWHSEEGYTDVPTETAVPPEHEAELLKGSTNKQYKLARERWLKLTNCPFCGSKAGPLALRRWSASDSALGHFCSAASCSWNARFEKPTPLPFYVVDEDIYDLAPTVLLGTIDKLAALGQSQRTIRKFFGMFGFAPLMEKKGGRLFVPGTAADWEEHPGGTTRALYPSFKDGDKKFFDPFPSLLIQDEAHLLDESLGTFAGLFETALEAGFDELAPLLGDQLVKDPTGSQRRKIKVIAASATVSDPQRQMRNLYQRLETVQFPHPGPDLYSSFYASPKQPDESDDDQERRLLSCDDVELRSHWARVYAAILTNGHRHTVAMASVLAHYHQLITSLYERLRSADLAEEAREELIRWVSHGATEVQFKRLLRQADFATLLTLVDLHRISLTYVTNKKGGDQVIDTEKSETYKLHKEAGFPQHELKSELISGAVSAADIQDIVRRAEKRVAVGEEFPELNDTLRSVIATSAISHGVDVEEFNAMFFAGMPSDIAEYIQASSRVGRTHVGFSLLVPVPQRYRDRFVLEIHDIFHRFLERMILPASVDRWAEKALVRVMPSFFQEFVCGIRVAAAICEADESRKSKIATNGWADEVGRFLSDPKERSAVQAFMERALGFAFDPPPDGVSYYRSVLKEQINRYQQDLSKPELITSTQTSKFFEVRDRLNRPMTSLRDVDLPGLIHESKRDAAAELVKNEGATARVMRFIRRGNGADIDSTDERTELRGANK